MHNFPDPIAVKGGPTDDAITCIAFALPTQAEGRATEVGAAITRLIRLAENPPITLVVTVNNRRISCGGFSRQECIDQLRELLAGRLRSPHPTVITATVEANQSFLAIDPAGTTLPSGEEQWNIASAYLGGDQRETLESGTNAEMIEAFLGVLSTASGELWQLA